MSKNLGENRTSPAEVSARANGLDLHNVDRDRYDTAAQTVNELGKRVITLTQLIGVAEGVTNSNTGITHQVSTAIPIGNSEKKLQFLIVGQSKAPTLREKIDNFISDRRHEKKFRELGHEAVPLVIKALIISKNEDWKGSKSANSTLRMPRNRNVFRFARGSDYASSTLIDPTYQVDHADVRVRDSATRNIENHVGNCLDFAYALHGLYLPDNHPVPSADEILGIPPRPNNEVAETSQLDLKVPIFMQSSIAQFSTKDPNGMRVSLATRAHELVDKVQA